MIIKKFYDRIVYYVDELPHRSNGPAIIIDGKDNWCWKLAGEFHRYYGKCDNITHHWYIHDQRIK